MASIGRIILGNTMTTTATNTTTYTWNIVGLYSVNTYTGYPLVVTDVMWNYSGERWLPDYNTSYQASVAGDQVVNFDPNNFTDFYSLTEEQVIDWVKADLGTAAIDQYTQQIDATIASQANITTQSGEYQPLPWSP
jgi:hypothetical protein